MLLETIAPLSQINVGETKPETISEKPLTSDMVKIASLKMCEKLGLHPIGEPVRMGVPPINTTLLQAKGESR